MSRQIEERGAGGKHGHDRHNEVYPYYTGTPEQGDVLYFNGTLWILLHHDTAGKFLSTGGHGANPSWVAQSSDIPLPTGPEKGDVIYYNGSSWVVLHHGTNDDVLTSQGHGANPHWETCPHDVSAYDIYATLSIVPPEDYMLIYKWGDSKWGVIDGPDLNSSLDHGALAGKADNDHPQYMLTPASPEQGDVLYYNGSNWVVLHHGADGQVLTSKGHGANPAWETPIMPTYDEPFFVTDRVRLGEGAVLTVDAPAGPGQIEYAFLMIENSIFKDHDITLVRDGVPFYIGPLSNFLGVYGSDGINGPYGSCFLSSGMTQYQLERSLTYDSNASIGLTNLDSILGTGSHDMVIGNAPGAGVANHVAERCHWQKFTALDSCNVEQIRIKCGAACQAMVALYDDNAGTPGDVLTASVDTAMVAGYNIVETDSTPIVAGTEYWLAFNSDTAHVQYLAGTSQVNRYKAIAYAGFAFPDDPAGLTSVTTYIDEIGGYSGSFFDVSFGGKLA